MFPYLMQGQLLQGAPLSGGSGHPAKAVAVMSLGNSTVDIFRSSTLSVLLGPPLFCSHCSLGKQDSPKMWVGVTSPPRVRENG